MIDPCTQYILYQERQTELMAQIERRLANQERAEAGAAHQPGYFSAQPWLQQVLKHLLKGKVFTTWGE